MIDGDTQADIVQQRATALISALESIGHNQAHDTLPTAGDWQRAYDRCCELRARCDVLAAALVKLIIAPTEYIFPPEWGVQKAPPPFKPDEGD